MNNVVTPKMAVHYEQNGIPFGFIIKQCQESSFRINWIMELNIALWRGFTIEKFMSLLKDELRFTNFNIQEQELILNNLQTYIDQRDTFTLENYYFIHESEKLLNL